MSETLTLLIIDDNPDDRENYVRLLKKIPAVAFRCHEAVDGDAGLDCVAKFAPQCVLLDYSLPGPNGLDVLKRIKASRADMPVIMLTGQGNEAIAVQAIKHGADDYLAKVNMTPDSLLRSIRMAMEHCHLQRTIDEQEQLLFKNEMRCQQLIDGVRDHAFCWLDAEGFIESWNSGAEKMHGYKAAEIIGQHFFVFHTPEARRDGLPLKELQQALTSGQYLGEGWRVRKDGSRFWASVEIDPLFDPAGKHIGFVKVTRDVTERKNAETQSRQLLEKLMQSNTELERFAYVASHDMQEPVRMVMSFSKIVADEYGDKLGDEGRDYLKFIVDSAGRIYAMIDDLLDYARLGGETALELVDGTLELEHVLANLGGLIKETGARITYDRLPQFEGNPVQFMRLMQNLIANAVKYQSPGRTPEIHIGAEEKDDGWTIFVRDNGVGVDEAYLKQIFEPFRRLHTWDKIKGTGIGLAVCKRIAENHGGAIWVDSVPGKGSVFYVFIPKRNAERRAA